MKEHIKYLLLLREHPCYLVMGPIQRYGASVYAISPGSMGNKCWGWHHTSEEVHLQDSYRSKLSEILCGILTIVKIYQLFNITLGQIIIVCNRLSAFQKVENTSYKDQCQMMSYDIIYAIRKCL